jgi:hypothetical protein
MERTRTRGTAHGADAARHPFAPLVNEVITPPAKRARSSRVVDIQWLIMKVGIGAELARKLEPHMTPESTARLKARSTSTGPLVLDADSVRELFETLLCRRSELPEEDAVPPPVKVHRVSFAAFTDPEKKMIKTALGQITVGGLLTCASGRLPCRSRGDPEVGATISIGVRGDREIKQQEYICRAVLSMLGTRRKIACYLVATS